MLNNPRDISDILSLGLKPEHFEIDTYRKIFDVILRVREAGADAGIIEVGVEIFNSSSANVKAVFADVITKGAISLNGEHFAKTVINSHFQRTEGENLSNLLSQYAKARNPNDLLAIRHQMSDVLAKNPVFDIEKNKSVRIGDLCETVLHNIEDEIKRCEGSKIAGINTGVDKLNMTIYGWQKKRMHVIGARTSVGKTTLACNFAYTAAMAGANVVFFTVEMSREEITEKIISRAGGVKMAAIRTGNVTDSDMDGLLRGTKEVFSLPFYINDSTGGRWDKIDSECQRLSLVGKMDFVIIDYLQLLKANGRFQNRQAELSEITANTKRLAMDYDVPVLALAQLNRDIEKTQTRMPVLSDLRDSGTIEQDADVVAFIHRDRDNVDIVVRKNRNGEKDISIGLRVDLSRQYMGA